MIGYPVWYRGGCPDVERVLRDLLSAQLTGVSVVSWLPPDYATTLTDGGAFVRVFRMGGRINVDNRNWVDEARVQIAALCAGRDDSWALIEFIRQVMYAYRDGGSVLSNGSKVFIEVPGEVVGPQLIPEAMRDERLVPVTFDVYTDRPRGLPIYREELGLNAP